MIVSLKRRALIDHHLERVRELVLPAQAPPRIDQPVQAPEQPPRLTDIVNPRHRQSALIPIRFLYQPLHPSRRRRVRPWQMPIGITDDCHAVVFHIPPPLNPDLGFLFGRYRAYQTHAFHAVTVDRIVRMDQHRWGKERKRVCEGTGERGKNSLPRLHASTPPRQHLLARLQDCMAEPQRRVLPNKLDRRIQKGTVDMIDNLLTVL